MFLDLKPLVAQGQLQELIIRHSYTTRIHPRRPVAYRSSERGSIISLFFDVQRFYYALVQLDFCGKKIGNGSPIS